jgi:hypothetical protein
VASGPLETIKNLVNPAEPTETEAEGLQKTIKRYGRSRIFRDEKGPTYEHRFLKGPETVAVRITEKMPVPPVISC